MPDLAPEARAREQIDALLTAAGWTLQNYDRFDPTVARFIALREIPVKGGRCDYLLLADRLPISVVEAKKAGTLSAVAEQSLFQTEGWRARLGIFWLKDDSLEESANLPDPNVIAREIAEDL